LDENSTKIQVPRLTTGTRYCACGSRKQYWAKMCKPCDIARRKPPIDLNVYTVEGVLCRRIPLTKDRYALIWESDYDYVAQWFWHAIWSENEKDYYAARGTNGKEELTTIMLARVLMQPPEDKEVDHWNHLTLDNRRSNLRVVTPNQNVWNQRTRTCNTSGQTGVSWHKVAGKWFSYINPGTGRVNLGYYDSYAVACRVRRESEIRYFGEHRCANSEIDASLREQIANLLVWNR
jgi:hypothetical protein